MNNVCYRTLKFEKNNSLETYISLGGYSSLKKILKGEIEPNDIIKLLQDSDLRGRGGAGFPTGLKIGFLNRNHDKNKYLICNSDESEPGTCKDRDILRYNPHQVIEGIAIASYVLNADLCINYMRGEFLEPLEIMENALKEFYGMNLYESEHVKKIKIINHMGAGAYICGEETALLNSIEGKRGLPRFKPPFPAQFGLYGCPTNVNNTETLASIPVILEKGSKWFNQIAKGGTKIFSVSGHVKNPNNFELPLGTKIEKIINLAGGLFANRKLKAIIPGGSSMKLIPHWQAEDLSMDYESLKSLGSGLGSGGIVIMDDSTCMVKALNNIVNFYANESCGQCSPCREGTSWAKKTLNRIVNKQGRAEDAETLIKIANNMEGRTICAFGEAAAWPIQSFIKHFKNEFIYYAINKRSIILQNHL
jgi:NADH-quinone oxidoreductase subunit F